MYYVSVLLHLFSYWVELHVLIYTGDYAEKAINFIRLPLKFIFEYLNLLMYDV